MTPLSLGIELHRMLGDCATADCVLSMEQALALRSLGFGVARHVKGATRAYSFVAYPGFSFGAWIERDAQTDDAVYTVRVPGVVDIKRPEVARMIDRFARGYTGHRPTWTLNAIGGDEDDAVLRRPEQTDFVSWEDDDAPPPGYPAEGRFASKQAFAVERHTLGRAYKAQNAARLRAALASSRARV